MIVLMQNDYPIGIYTTPELADAATSEHYQRHYAHDHQRTMADYHYRQYTFVVDARAK